VRNMSQKISKKIFNDGMEKRKIFFFIRGIFLNGMNEYKATD